MKIVENITNKLFKSDIPKYFAESNLDVNRRNIVFLCPATNKPIGGVKVIYQQTDVINSSVNGVSAFVLHPLDPKFKCTWFETEVLTRSTLGFDPKCDLVIIPEFWAVPHARLLQKIGVRYGIYVQNGYSASFNYGEELDVAYANAALVLCISDDSVECVNLAFPGMSQKIHRVHYSVDRNKFKASKNKDNVICYMPRKLKSHSDLFLFFIRKHLPIGWSIKKIDGYSESQVAEILGKSKIFLSFSEFEGCPLPPVEAALSGCYVVGYTGEGAKEYWHGDIFTEVDSGDIRFFVEAVLTKIERMDGGLETFDEKSLQALAERYASEVELLDMHFLADKTLKILHQM